MSKSVSKKLRVLQPFPAKTPLFGHTLRESPTRNKRPEVGVASFTAVGNPAAYSATLRARLRISVGNPAAYSATLRARLRMVTLRARLRAGQTHACSVRGSSKLRRASSKLSHARSVAE